MEHLLAQADYQMLAPIPQLLKAGSSETTTINAFIEGIVPLIIGVAGGLAVLRIIIGGIQYMSTDAWGGKKEAKGTITNAIVGLLLVIGAYTLLNTINPALVNFNLKIEGLETGGALDPNSGEVSTKSAVELGCSDPVSPCAPIDGGEINVSPNACTNNPCFVYRTVITYLNQIKADLIELNEDDDIFISWQIIKAFPRAGSVDPYYKPNPGADIKKVGSRLELSIANPSIPKIVHFVNALQERAGTTFIYYNICPADLLDEVKQSKNPALNSAATCKLVCRPNSTQSAMIATEVFEDGTRPANCN